MRAKSVLIRGEQDIQFRRGLFRVHGVSFTAGSGLHVPLGKSVFVDQLSDDCELQAQITPHVHDPRMMSEFEEKLAQIRDREWKRIIVLGEMDSGKSFLCTRLVNELVTERKTVGLIDCDIGQSDIGPPGCIGAASIEQPIVFMTDAPVMELAFVGSHSPEGHLTVTLSGLHKLMHVVLKRTETVIVNTCGWTRGDGARLLKTAKLELVEPDGVIILERQGELMHLVQHLAPEMVLKMNVSPDILPRSPEIRKTIRELLSSRYFQGSTLFSLSFEQIRTMGSYFRTGREVQAVGGIPVLYGEDYGPLEGCLVVPIEGSIPKADGRINNVSGPIRVISPGSEKGILVGLLDGKHHMLGLGLIEKIDFAGRVMTIRSPVPDQVKIKVVFFGSLRYEEDGREAGYIIPGSW
ncbi:hypothetical protein JXQ70_13735 [bacterium]|nr:hypothetical protein [bacterium]